MPKRSVDAKRPYAKRRYEPSPLTDVQIESMLDSADQLLGAGQSGHVYQLAGADAAKCVKVVRIDSVRNCMRECRLAARLCNGRSPRLVRSVAQYKSEHFFAIEMRREQCSLSRLLCVLDEHTMMKAARHVAEALTFLHANQVVHADVKPANVLYTHEHTFALCDFGCAVVLRKPSIEFKTNGLVCAELFRPPEVVACCFLLDIAPVASARFCCTTAVDIWSYAVLLVCMLRRTTRGIFRYPPPADEFQEHTQALLIGIARGIGLPTLAALPHHAHLCIDLITIMASPVDSIVEPCDRPFLPDRLDGAPAELASLVRRSLVWDWEQRPTARHCAELLANY